MKANTCYICISDFDHVQIRVQQETDHQNSARPCGLDIDCRRDLDSSLPGRKNHQRSSEGICANHNYDDFEIAFFIYFFFFFYLISEKKK